MRFLFFFPLAFSLVACGSYRTGGGYRGAGGGFKAPSDYSTGVDSYDSNEADTQGLRGKLGNHSQYIPRADFKMVWPVEQVRINRGFHPPEDPRHEGLDLGGQKGMPIWAAHEGLVIYTGTGFNGYGKMVLIEYNKEWATLYGHLNEITCREGQVVAPGDSIGTMGATGHATGVHLHFEVMHNHTPTDPIPLLTRPVKFVSKSRARKHARK
jgi:murein DD-endopeptidase MepM/ murein hydrolase activator NlpD